jgi:hypothetical protein
MVDNPGNELYTDIDRELDRLITQLGYSPQKVQQLLEIGPTSFYEELKAGELETYWHYGRKITGASLRKRLKRKLEEARGQPLRPGGSGRSTSVAT